MALEMAQRLRAAGERVAWLGLIETPMLKRDWPLRLLARVMAGRLRARLAGTARSDRVPEAAREAAALPPALREVQGANTAAFAPPTALRYLVLIGHAEVLLRLFGAVSAPAAVAGELRHPNAPDPVRAWAADPPPWLAVHPDPAGPMPEALQRLDPGERAGVASAPPRARLLQASRHGRIRAMWAWSMYREMPTGCRFPWRSPYRGSAEGGSAALPTFLHPVAPVLGYAPC